MSTIRPLINKDFVDNSLQLLKFELSRRLAEKGYGSFSSSHEILGVITEEYYELIKAVQEKPFERTKEDEISVKKERIFSELMDIAVACVFGAASLNDVDWL